MKKLLLLATAAAMTLPAAARSLNAEEALGRALESTQTDGMRRAAAKAQMKLTYTGARLKGGDGNSFYVFNRGAGNGFVIASGDDRLRPVLATADSGSFSATDMPDAMKWWLGEYEAQIEQYLATAPEEAPHANSVFDNYAGWSAIEPLVEVQWNQLSPYNRQCPKINGQATPTGCVATAMATVIRTLGYANCKNKKTYTPNNEVGEISFDFNGYKPDFSKMPASVNDKSPADEINEVAKLMYACGVAVNMGYRVQASGAGDPINGLKLYFGYDKASTTIGRSGYTTPQWEKIIYEQLKAGRPVYYAGSSNQGGHAFVCDGYQPDGMFHFNWGWGGLSDGYFTLSVMNPRNQGVGSFSGGYNLGHSICLFVVPDSQVPEVPESQNPFDLQYLPSNGVDALPTPEPNGKLDFFPMMYRFYGSPGGKSYDVGLSLLLKSTDGSTDDIFLEPTAYKTTHNSNSATWNFEADFAKTDVPAGTYCAYIAYKVKGFDGIFFAKRNTLVANDHYRLTIDAKGNRTYTPEQVHTAGIEIYDIKTNELYANDKSNSVEFLLSNFSGADFAETVSLHLVPDGGGSPTVIGTSVMNLPDGETRPISMTFTAPKAGKYTLRLHRDSYGVYMGNNSLSVNVNAGSRPGGGKEQTTEGMCEIALWVNNAYTPLEAISITAGDEFAATTAISSFMPQDVEYSLSFFAHGQTSGALRSYPIAKKSLGYLNWSRGDDFSIKPDLAPGVYTIAFTDASGKRLSRAVDCYINLVSNGMTFRIDGSEATLVGAATAAKVTVPATVGNGGKDFKVTAIADGVFNGRSDLKEVELPASLTHIGFNAFRATTGLAHVVFKGSQPPFENSVLPFYGVNSDAAFYVSPEAYDAHAKAFNSPCHLYATMSSFTIGGSVSVMAKKEAEATITLPAANCDPRFTATSENPEIATAKVIDGKLIVSGVAPGKTTVSVASLQPGVAPVKVEVSVENYIGITLDPESTELGLGETCLLKPVFEPQAPVGMTLKWSSSNPAVATVDDSGKVSAIAPGEAVITVAAANRPEINAACTITVKSFVTDIELNSTELNIKIGQTISIEAKALPADADNTKLTWSTSDPAVAEVTRLGKVTGKAIGTAVITVSATDARAFSREITVIVSEISAIDEVEAAGGDDAVYFDLSGRRITNPAHGIYVRKSGGKSSVVRL